MAASDPAERSELARLAVLSRWAKTKDRTAATQAARDGLMAKFDPGPEVPEPQRSKMIRAGLEAHLIRVRRARQARRQAQVSKLAGEIVTEGGRSRREAEQLAEEILAEFGEAAPS